jgi:hypothetical protein
MNGQSMQYSMPAQSETVYYGEVTVRKQEGKYSLQLQAARANIDCAIAEKLHRALQAVVNELNGEASG